MIHGRTICWGCMQWHITIARAVDSLGQQFLDLLDQAFWCHAGMARSSWLHRCGMGCHRHWCQGILMNSRVAGTAGACFIWVAYGAGTKGVGCMHGAGWDDAGCAAKKWGLVRACGVAVVPLGTMSVALTLHSLRYLRAWQYVEPLLVCT